MATLYPGDFPGVGDNGQAFLRDLAKELANVTAAVNQLIADFNAHVHSGITAGAANSAVPTANTSANVGSVTEVYIDPLTGQKAN